MPPTAKFELPNGTMIEVDGSIDDIARLAQLYSSPNNGPRAATAARQSNEDVANGSDDIDIPELVGLIKDCDDAELIEQRVLNQRSALNRVLLPLYIAHKHVSEMLGLTSGDIEKITDQLGVKVSVSNASGILSNQAKSYVTGDAVRKKGAVVRYRLNRRGVQYFDELLRR